MALSIAIPTRYFYPRSPCGERLFVQLSKWALDHFYPRSPCGERLFESPICEVLLDISIHALLAESDCVLWASWKFISIFLSTLSLRRATPQMLLYAKAPIFLSTLSLRRATAAKRCRIASILQFLSTLSLRRATYIMVVGGRGTGISIHALLAESDGNSVNTGGNPTHISIHALLAESDGLLRHSTPSLTPFLSTLSLRRATSTPQTRNSETKYFYPRSPCGERQWLCYSATTSAKFLSTLSLRRATLYVRPLCESEVYFYPRSPCGERQCIRQITVSTIVFLSTLSLRRATTMSPHKSSPVIFLSTLSLRRATGNSEGNSNEELFLSTLSLRRATTIPVVYPCGHIHFYPRSPCGERRNYNMVADDFSVFLSTLSLRRATCLARLEPPVRYKFLSTLSLRRATLRSVMFMALKRIFLSTLSLRRATRVCVSNAIKADISIHALLAESDRGLLHHKRQARYFYPRSPCGERLFVAAHVAVVPLISIHALLAESDIFRKVGPALVCISIHALLAESDG